MILGIINYVRGSVRIEIQGAAIERFLNLCAQNQIDFWDVRRIAPDLAQATVRISGFRQLRRFTRRAMCSVRIVGKRGVPFQARRLRPRAALWGGAALCALLLWVASQMIWTIDASNCDQSLQPEALELASQAGLRPGAPARQVDGDQVRDYIMTHSDKFSFVAVNIRGSWAQIIAQGRTPTPEMTPVDQPCDIVADKTGVIVSMQVKAGVAMKKVGETVVEGDILATGTIVSAQGEVYQVHAMADVELRTWRTLRSVMPTQLTAKIPTGRSKTRWALVIGGRRFNLSFIEKEPFQWYDTFIEKKFLRLTKNTVLPVALVRQQYVEYQPRPFTVSQEVCAQVMERRQREALAQRLPEAQVVQADFSCQYSQPFAQAALTVECREKTGVLTEVSGIAQETTEDGND